jgi:hypothetical protein
MQLYPLVLENVMCFNFMYLEGFRETVVWFKLHVTCGGDRSEQLPLLILNYWQHCT